MSDIHALQTNLDLKQNLNIYANCKQLDTLHLVLNIFDDGVQADLSNYNVRLKAMKADKIPLIQDTEYSVVNNIVTIIAHEQLTTTSGITKIELQFINKKTGEKKATFNLNLKVIANVLESERSISTATYTLLEELENKLDQAIDISENMDEAIEINKTLSTAIIDASSGKSALEIETAKGNVLKTNLSKNITDGNIINTTLENSITTGNKLKTDIDIKNIQAESNIKAMESFEDVTKLTQIVTDHTTQLSEKAKQSDLAQLSNPSLLINDCFQVWQRGTSIQYASGGTVVYTADRWAIASGGSTLTISSLSDGGLRINNTADFTANTRFFQNVEVPKKFQGKTVTLTVRAKSSVNGKKIGLSIVNPSVVKEVSLTTEYQDYFLTGVLPNSDIAMIGIGLSASASNYFGLTNITNFPVGSIDISNIKLEVGNISTPFIPRPIGQELALCMRYYEVGTSPWIKPLKAYNFIIGGTTFKEVKRVTPTFVISNPNTGTVGKLMNTSGLDSGNNIYVGAANTYCITQVNSSIALADDDYCFMYKADAEIY